MNEKTFEENMAELQGIVEKLENGDINLDDAITEFEKAMALIKSCDAKLKQAEDSIAKIVDDWLPLINLYPLKNVSMMTYHYCGAGFNVSSSAIHLSSFKFVGILASEVNDRDNKIYLVF